MTDNGEIVFEGQTIGFRRELPESIANEIKSRIVGRGVKYTTAAKYIGVSAAYMRDLAHGRRVPSPGVAEDIITILALSPTTAEALRAVVHGP